MRPSITPAIANTLREARRYLDKLTSDASIDPDFPKMHGYLNELSPCLAMPDAPADLLHTVAQLYFESMRYQESAQVLQRVKDPRYNEMKFNDDFYNGYFCTFHHWASRQSGIWKEFAAREKVCAGGELQASRGLTALRIAWDSSFPAMLVQPAPDEHGKKVLTLGNLYGALSLVPMLYLVRHVPASISRRWSVLLEEPNIIYEGIRDDTSEIWAKDVQVRILPSTAYPGSSKVRLQVWHPALAKLAEEGLAAHALEEAVQVLNLSLTLSSTALYVEEVSLAEKPLSGSDVLPLPALRDWFPDHGMPLGIPPEEILERRRQSFTRTPANSNRPRADILRGETCMPELEEIYCLRNGRAMAALQRYGVSYWFLTVPNKACGGDFAGFRSKLEARLRKELGDQVFFTGWAEGTRNCYIDFLSLTGIPALSTLNKYLQQLPRGKDVRICSFYWNSPLRTADFIKEMSELEAAERQLMYPPHIMQPPKDLVSPKEQAALEKAFRDTQWTAVSAAEPRKFQGEEEPADLEALRTKLQEALNEVIAMDQLSLSYNTTRLNALVDSACDAAAHLDVDDAFCDTLSSLLMALDRFREAARWKSQVAPSEEKTTFLYSCDIASGYPLGVQPAERRQQTFWKLFTVKSAALPESFNIRDTASLMVDLDAAIPFSEAILQPAVGGGKDIFRTGLPDGILTLPAVQYFCNHRPAVIGKRWDVFIAKDGITPALLTGNRISITEKGGKVSLAVWNPDMGMALEHMPREGQWMAPRLVNEVLPMGARLLYVSDIKAVDLEPANAFPATELRQQMEARGYQVDVSLDTLLDRRIYLISREPKDTGRPRDDILRGETCMPELERIHRRIDEQGQIILERYGLYAGFLMIPNAVCAEDPALYRQKLERYITLAERDKVFFTGWAEGTQFNYLDFISMDGLSLLNTLDAYARGHEDGKQLRLSSFFWRSVPRSCVKAAANAEMRSKDHADFAEFARTHTVPGFPVPSAAEIAAFEASFRPDFTPEDFRAPKPAEPPVQAPVSAVKNPLGGNKKLSKAQRKALNNKNNQNNKNNKNSKGSKNKKKR